MKTWDGADYEVATHDDDGHVVANWGPLSAPRPISGQSISQCNQQAGSVWILKNYLNPPNPHYSSSPSPRADWLTLILPIKTFKGLLGDQGSF